MEFWIKEEYKLEEYFDVLNEKGEYTGKIETREKCHREGLWHNIIRILCHLKVRILGHLFIRTSIVDY